MKTYQQKLTRSARHFLSYGALSVVVLLSAVSMSEVKVLEDDFSCCPDVTSITVSLSSICTGGTSMVEADVNDLSTGLECSELEQNGFTWEWTVISGCTITHTGDDALITVTAPLGGNIEFRVKAVSSDPNCTAPRKSKRFVIPVTSVCGS
jgi:hypothetical protein